jgi:hypothetical protein
MKTYQHTQSGRKIVGFMLALAVVAVVIAARFQPALYGAVIILLVTAWLFSSLAVEIADGALRWRFGPGLVQKKVMLVEIESVKVVQTSFFEGWGIHLSRFGWLYNISGYGAVAITLKSGKRFALGSDEPDVLARQITAAIKS